MFTKKDILQFNSSGIRIEDVNQQLKYFINGFPFLRLIRAAKAGDGIKLMEEGQLFYYRDIYVHDLNKKRVCFIPASGAATRMFKHLYEFREEINKNGNGADLINRKEHKLTKNFFNGIKQFGFYKRLKKKLIEDDLIIEELLKEFRYDVLIDYLLSKKGLNYGNLPKGLICFHSYENFERTAMEEHLAECALYGRGSGSKVCIHFTISKEHKKEFLLLVKEKLSNYNREYNVKYKISFSEQKPSTDTIAVNMKNEPFRLDDGRILFRPGGHGSLLANLNGIKSDLVFIKNIDNVVHSRLKEPTILYKQVLAGILINCQQKIFSYLRILNSKTEITTGLLNEMKSFLTDELCYIPGKKINKKDIRQFLFEKFNRPIRVCGVVKNQGEPGGGPFWVKNDKDDISLQIVETSQIDLKNPEQNKILKSSTHFNPVDIICGLRNFKGKKFDLMKYRDLNTGFISKKSMKGKDLKAFEHPGLWNGAMSDWITIFVEVPVDTFNPVKTVNDLLRAEHLDV